MTYAWSKRTQGLLTGIDWSNWLLRSDTCIDPYLVWADVSGAAGFAGRGEDAGADRKWPFIIELSEPGLPAQYLDDKQHGEVPWIFGVIDVPGVYKTEELSEPWRWTIRGKYVTAHVHPRDVHHLLCSKHVKRAQLGLPRIRQVVPGAERTPKQEPGSGRQPRVVVGVVDDGMGVAHSKLLDELGMPRVRYLWDQDGRREDRLKGGWVVPRDLGYGAEIVPKTLEAALRDRPPTNDDPWGPYRVLNYGRYRLDPYAHSSAPLDADGRCLPVESMLSRSHGQSVTDLAAGFPPTHRGQVVPLRSDLLPLPRSAVEAATEIKRATAESKLAAYQGDIDAQLARLDSADQWHLVCVQLPVRTVADTSGGSLAVHVLDGIRYIIERARRIPFVGDTEPDEDDPTYRSFVENPVIINVSYGALGGAHDGSSILEEAMQNLNDAVPQPVWVVLAAGNAHRASAHASVDLVPGEHKELVWRVGPDNPLESYLEIWLPDRDVNGHIVPARMVEQIAVDVRTPSGQQLVFATVGDLWQLREERDGETTGLIAAVVFARRVVQGKHGTMVLLATASTRASTNRNAAPHGDWAVTLVWPSQSSAERPTLCAHVWTERSDLLFGAARGQQNQVFADEPVGEFVESDPEARAAWRDAQRNPALLRAPHGVRPQYSLSSLGGGPPAREGFALQPQRRGEVVIVGAHRLVDCEVSSASSGGPSRLTSRRDEAEALLSRGTLVRNSAASRMRPDVSAAGDISSAMVGLRTAGFHSTVEARISATSAAAALVTRAVANVQYAYTIGGSTSAAAAESLLFENDGLAALGEGAGRATLTPLADDAFRRGSARLR